MIPQDLLQSGLLAHSLREEVVASVTAEPARNAFLDPDDQSLGFRSAVRRMPENTLCNHWPLHRQRGCLQQRFGAAGISDTLLQR